MMKSKKGSPRSHKVAEEIKRVVSESLVHGDIGSYENVNPAMIAVTDVVVSSCLQHAKIFVSPISSDLSNDSCLNFLEYHNAQFRKCIADNIRLKFVPEIKFFIDDSIEYANKIEKLLANLHG